MANTDSRDPHRFEERQDLDALIREAIAEERGVDPSAVENPLYEDINPDALDNLVWEDARAHTTVELTTNAVQVTLWGDGSISIDVLDEHADR